MKKKKETKSIKPVSNETTSVLISKPILGLLMMVKNEEKRIKVTLESVKDIVDCFIIFDTGSEDDTINIIKNYAKEINKKLYLKQGTFINFSISRNISIDFGDDKADYLLLLDCNDELKNGKILRNFINNYTEHCTAFHLCQEWWNGISLDKYYNLRLIKTKCEWKYKGAVHEYLCCDNEKKNKICKINDTSIYQDRTKDDDKSFKRFSRDKLILFDEYLKDTKNTRTVFYLAQTYKCLNENENAYRFYKERSELLGFTEERFHAYYRCGELAQILKHSEEEIIIWYIKAYEYSCKTFDTPRAEPLFKLAEYYRDKCWDLCFLYLKKCCELEYPHSAILFVDRRLYDYKRWNLMAIVAFYVKHDKDNLKLGKDSCLKAIKAENKPEDIKNLIFYVKGEKEAKKLLKTK